MKSVAETVNGAGDGNRTHATSLEGWGSTIELHPRMLRFRHSATYDTIYHLNCQEKILHFFKLFESEERGGLSAPYSAFSSAQMRITPDSGDS